MFYEETKIYSDGSHYIAIPKTTRPTKKRKKISKDEIELKEKADKVFEENKGKKKVEKKKPEPKKAETPKPAPAANEGQLDMFSMLGGETAA